jgi:hypothetical protein
MIIYLDDGWGTAAHFDMCSKMYISVNNDLLSSWFLNLQLPVQSVPITTNVGSSIPAHGEVYSIQQYVVQFVSDLRKVSGFSLNIFYCLINVQLDWKQVIST